MFWLRNKKNNFRLCTQGPGEVTGNPYSTSTFANSEDSDEMQHNAAFYQGLHCL